MKHPADLVRPTGVCFHEEPFVFFVLGRDFDVEMSAVSLTESVFVCCDSNSVRLFVEMQEDLITPHGPIGFCHKPIEFLQRVFVGRSDVPTFRSGNFLQHIFAGCVELLEFGLEFGQCILLFSFHFYLFCFFYHSWIRIPFLNI